MTLLKLACLLYISVYAVRPPSGPSDRRRILSRYTRQLTSTTGKHYQLFSQSAPSEPNSTSKHNSRRIQSAKPKLYRTENADVQSKNQHLIHKRQRPVSASAASNIEPNVFGFDSGKAVCGAADTGFSFAEVQSTLQQVTTHTENLRLSLMKKHKGKYEM